MKDSALAKRGRKRRAKARKASPYRRLETELVNARRALTEAVDIFVATSLALDDAMVFFERVAGSKSDWTIADVKRLDQIRAFCRRDALMIRTSNLTRLLRVVAP